MANGQKRRRIDSLVFSISSTLYLSIILLIFLGQSWAREIDPNYKFAGIKAPESPYKNTWSAFQTDLFSGSFSYNFNIDVPPGTNGMAPKITVSYNSHSAKGRPGWVGMGWEIPLSYVQRDIEYTRKDANDDTFDLVLDGAKRDLVFVVAEGRYHTKIESFMRIERFSSGAPNERGEYWIATAKNGMRYRFGYNADAEHLVASTDPNMANRYVWRWSLDQVTDTNGNTINYSYAENAANGEAYLTRIEYNNDRQRVVEFVTGERTDPGDPTEHVGGYLFVDQGSEIIETKSLNEIRTYVSGQLARRYVFSYKRNEPETQLLLKSITQYGSDGASSLPPVRFDYKKMKKDFNKEKWRATSKNKYVRKLEKSGDLY